jgi:hypothetical protein
MSDDSQAFLARIGSARSAGRMPSLRERHKRTARARYTRPGTEGCDGGARVVTLRVAPWGYGHAAVV